jgi:hypothetical protein
MRNRLALFVPDWGHGHLAWALGRAASAWCGRGLDVVGFHERSVAPAATLPFARMSVAESYGWDGQGLAVTWQTADRLLQCPSLSRRLFYVWDLEWLRPHWPDWEWYARIVRDERLVVVARSSTHARALEVAFNRRPGVVADHDLDLLLPHLGLERFACPN